MRTTSVLATLGFAGLVLAGPCTFHQLRDAAAAGNLNTGEAAIGDRMSHDPSYSPALGPKAAVFMKSRGHA